MLLFISCAFSKVPNKDIGMSAVEGGDFTALIEGCGHPIIAGYTYCRKTEGDAANDNLYFIGPITNCKRDFCVEYKLYGPNGEVLDGGSLNRKANRKAIPWSKILGRDTFEINDRGFWLYTYKVYWLDKDGNENTSVSEGEIRMRVIRKEYTPLDNVAHDINFVPQWSFYARGGETIRMTTGMRTYVGY